MAWLVELSRDAERDLERFPRDVRDRLKRAIDELEINPFRSNVKPLKGPQWKGRYRRRVGPYRIIFKADPHQKRISISAILIKSKGTYQ